MVSPHQHYDKHMIRTCDICYFSLCIFYTELIEALSAVTEGIKLFIYLLYYIN